VGCVPVDVGICWRSEVQVSRLFKMRPGAGTVTAIGLIHSDSSKVVESGRAASEAKGSRRIAGIMQPV
jgi:hypothetical protein